MLKDPTPLRLSRRNTRPKIAEESLISRTEARDFSANSLGRLKQERRSREMSRDRVLVSGKPRVKKGARFAFHRRGIHQIVVAAKTILPYFGNQGTLSPYRRKLISTGLQCISRSSFTPLLHCGKTTWSSPWVSRWGSGCRAAALAGVRAT